MYNESIEWKKMCDVFGVALSRTLFHNKLYSIEDVKNYIEKYPFEQYHMRHATHYRYIGPVKYNKIVEALNKLEES
jgi:hypothetical protein